MLISTRGLYALRVLTDLAEHPGEGFCPLKELAKRQDISEKYLELIIQSLVKGGILDAARGKCGGYRFAKPPEQITAWDVLSLTESSLAAVGCQREGAPECERSPECRPLPLLQGLTRVIRDYLSECTIADMTRTASV